MYTSTASRRPERFFVKAISRLTRKSVIHRYLDPGDALGEAIFGLIMALRVEMRFNPELAADVQAGLTFLCKAHRAVL